jgi:hypothetical protein
MLAETIIQALDEPRPVDKVAMQLGDMKFCGKQNIRHPTPH